MSLNAKNTRSVVNLSDRPCKVTACATFYNFGPYEVVVFPSQTAANVAIGESRAARGPLEFFDPKVHFDAVRSYLQKNQPDRADVFPGMSEKMDADTLATMMRVGKRTIPKPSRDLLKKGNNQVLASYLILFGKPAIDIETGKELSKSVMLEQLFELFGYPLRDPEKEAPPAFGKTPRALVEVVQEREGTKEDNDDDAGNGDGEDE